MKQDSLLVFPCRFPIKVMGLNVSEFVPAIHSVVQQFDVQFDSSTTELRPSKAGNYMGMTIYVHATSQEHLDEIYRTLSTHPLVKIAL
ncbi:DUF493 family protein [Curvibacter sp. CHRR-16]|nr:DUF493 family protein [Curvibacter sp. CHRR-16]MBT0571833.1 DUF493 family protein [Curvibacter sp. CHRR-16]